MRKIVLDRSVDVYKIGAVNQWRWVMNEAMIFVEVPHRGERKVWSVGSQRELLSVVGKISENSISAEDYAVDTVDGALEWLGHDLRALHVLTEPADIEAWDDEQVLKAAEQLGWCAQ